MPSLARSAKGLCRAAALLGGLVVGAAALAASPMTQVGVSIHGVRSPEEFALMKQAGVEIVRMDLTWQVVERSAGRYDWAAYDTLIGGIVGAGLRPMIILAYSNDNHAPKTEVRKSDGKPVARTAAPANDEARRAYIEWAVAAIQRYAKHDPVWEIWNEPEHDFFWPPKASVGDFSQLTRDTCAALRRADRRATIIGPGAAKPPTWKDPQPVFLRDFLRSGAASCLDAISAHPYLNLSDIDRTPSVWRDLRSLIDGSAPTPIPRLVSSEWGLSTFGGRISDEEQAAYLVKMLLLNTESRVEMSVWYSWRDNGPDGSVAENRFGLLDTDLKPKPAWQALKHYQARFKGAEFVCRLPVKDTTVSALLLRQPRTGQLQVAAWTSKASPVPDISAWRTATRWQRTAYDAAPDAPAAADTTVPMLERRPSYFTPASPGVRPETLCP